MLRWAALALFSVFSCVVKVGAARRLVAECLHDGRFGARELFLLIAVPDISDLHLLRRVSRATTLENVMDAAGFTFPLVSLLAVLRIVGCPPFCFVEH